MNEQERANRRKKRAMTLAKDVIQAGYEDPALIRKLLTLAHESPDQVKQARDSYAFCLQIGMDNERAWALSGMANLAISTDRVEDQV